MAGPCQICKSPRRLVTENAILAGAMTVKEIAKKYNWGVAAVYLHKKHMRPRDEAALGGTPMEIAPAPSPPELPPDATDLQKVDADIKWIEERRGRLVGKAVAEKDLAALTGQLLTARRLRAKIAGGEITPGMYARNAHFHKIWGAIWESLRPYPKALEAAVKAALDVTGLKEEEL